MRLAYKCEWSADLTWFNQGWFRVFGYGLAWEWDWPPRFSHRLKIRQSLLIGKLRVYPIGPRPHFEIDAGDEQR